MIRRYLLLLIGVIVSAFITNAQEDTVHYFTQTQSNYHFHLSEGGSLHYDTVVYGLVNYSCELKIKNDHKKPIEVQRVHAPDGPIFLNSHPLHGAKIESGELMTIGVRLVQRPGPIRRTISLRYKIGKKEYEQHFEVCGYQFPAETHAQNFIKTLPPHGLEPSQDSAMMAITKSYRAMPYSAYKETQPLDFGVKRGVYFARIYDYPDDCLYELKNTTKDTLFVQRVDGMNYQLSYFIFSDNNWTYLRPRNGTIPPGESIIIKAKNNEPGVAKELVTGFKVEYLQQGEQKQWYFPIYGVLAYDENTLQRKKALENRVKKYKANPTPPPKPQTRKSGPEWFGDGIVRTFYPDSTIYDFVLDAEKYYPRHGRVNPLKKDLIFSWGQLSPEDLEKVYSFRFINPTEKPIYILKYSEGKGMNFKNVGRSIIEPGDTLKFEVWFDSDVSRHEYQTLEIRYRYEGREFTEKFHQWVDVQERYSDDAFPRPRLNSGDSIRIVMLEDDFEKQSFRKLQVTKDGKTFHPTLRVENGEAFYMVDKARMDTVFIELIDSRCGVLTKALLGREFNMKILHWYTNLNRLETHTYMGSPQPYDYQLNAFFVDWDRKSYTWKEVVQYLRSLGYYVTNGDHPYLKTPDGSQNITLQTKLANTKYKIHLLPSIRYSTVNERGWGGACEWWSNQVEIQFYDNISQDQAKQLLKNAGVYNYRFWNYDYYPNSYIVEFENVISDSFVKKLDKLWDMPQVKRINQRRGGIAGLD